MIKTAVVTGASRGLGLGAATALAAQKYRVFISGRNKENISDAASIIPNAEGFVVDISNTGQVNSFAKELAQRIDHLDLLINNAGVMIARPNPENPSSLANIDPEIALQTININTLGALRMTQALMPLLIQAEAPRIVNISSGMGGLNEMEGHQPAYRISKTALNAVTVITAAENKHPDLKVNSVCPGWVRTDMGGEHADRSIEEAMPGILWAAQLDSDGPTGGFFRDGKKIDW